jgi:hypothetical protein
MERPACRVHANRLLRQMLLKAIDRFDIRQALFHS